MAIVYVDEGSYTIQFGNEPPLTVTKGSVYIMPPYLPIRLVHYVSESKGYFSCKWIYLNLMLGNTIDITKNFTLPRVLDKQLSEAVGKKICFLVDNFTPVIKNFADAITIQSTVLNIFNDLSGVMKISFEHPDSMFFLSTLKYIDENISRPISVEHLAEMCNVSNSYFHQKFKKAIGMTPNKYIIKKRLNRAMEMLMSTEEKLSEIARQTGFCDQFHLSHEFKKSYDQSPNEYRKNYAAGNEIHLEYENII